MAGSVALQRYLQRHIEADLPNCPVRKKRWRNVVVIPAYDESATLVETLKEMPADSGRTLVILVLNRPDANSSRAANRPLREAVLKLPEQDEVSGKLPLYELNNRTDLYLYDIDQLNGPLPASTGVGQARKAGCDLALQWIVAGGIEGPWICSTDADATLPPDYFERLDTVQADCAAAVFPFHHLTDNDAACNEATALYELRLHHYVLGLEYAGSPYAYHSLGSCLAVRCEHYAQVRGFPRRAAAEDFYLLNKLAKVGSIARLGGTGIALQSRASHRIPFGTGPAVQALLAATEPIKSPLFYHPACFTALRALLACVGDLADPACDDLRVLLARHGLQENLARQTQDAMAAIGLAAALDHCQRHSKDTAQFQRHFHQWFDGFRTLKFIHAMRDAGWAAQHLAALADLEPQLWPDRCDRTADIAALRKACQIHWEWC